MHERADYEHFSRFRPLPAYRLSDIRWRGEVLGAALLANRESSAERHARKRRDGGSGARVAEEEDGGRVRGATDVREDERGAEGGVQRGE